MDKANLRLAAFLLVMASAAAAAPPTQVKTARPTPTPTARAGIQVPPVSAVYAAPCGVESDELKTFVPASTSAEPTRASKADARRPVQRTQLSLVDQLGAIGQTVPIQARLKLKPEGTAVPNHTVHFWVDDHYLDHARTDAMGTALVEYKVEAFAIHNVRAKYFGNENCSGALAQNDLGMARAHTKLVLTIRNTRVLVGHDVSFEGTLTRTTDNRGLDGRAVAFAIDGQPQATAATSPSGKFIWNWAAPSVTVGNHGIRATFGGDQMYFETEASLPFAVAPPPKPAKLTLTGVEGAVGETKTARAQLTLVNPMQPIEFNPDGVPGVTIRVGRDRGPRWGGEQYPSVGLGTGVTDQLGVVMVSFKITDKPMGYTLWAHADGVEGVLEVNFASDPVLQVHKAPVTVAVAGPASARVGDAITITVTVRRATDGAPLQAMDVLLNPGLGRKNTGANGQAVFPVTVSSLGGIGPRTITAESFRPDWYLNGTGSLTINVSPKAN